MKSGDKRKEFLILGIFLATVFWTAAGIWIVRSLSDKDRATEQMNETKELAEATEVELPETSTEEVEENGAKFLAVDLSRLIQKNSDTVGWIQIPGTKVDYPFVQTKDNDFYRTHSFDQSYNTAGWPFLDAVNMRDLSDSHNIIYLHGKITGTQFEPVRSIIASNGWMEDPENFIIRTSTEKSNAIWQVFSIYKIPTTDDYLRISFANSTDLLELVNTVKGRSVYNFEVPFSEADKMLTFSIRYDDEYIVVIHAKRTMSSLKNAEEEEDEDLEPTEDEKSSEGNELTSEEEESEA